MRTIEISVAIVAAALTFGAAGAATAQTSSKSTTTTTTTTGSMKSMDRPTTGSTTTAPGASGYAPGQAAGPANKAAPGRSDNLPPGQQMQMNNSTSSTMKR